MSSLVSVKGPSITVFWSAENRTRFPLELGCSPSPASITPALASSSLYLPMSARVCSLGIAPASLSSLAFTSTITRIVIPPLVCEVGAGPPGGSDPVEPSLYRYVERGQSKSTRMMPLDPKWCSPEVYWAKTLRLGAKMSSYTPHLCIWGCCTGAPTPARAGSASRWAFFRVWPHGGHATGALYVPQARHSVASPFVATYRRLVPYLLGPSVTEAYRQAEVLTQDFDHLRLEWRQGRVVVGNLGTAIYPYELGGGMSRVPARPNTPTQRYFPQTGQLLQGDFLHFWQTRGGLATFGAPISGIQHEGNGDG